jgi:hypothetical protein
MRHNEVHLGQAVKNAMKEWRLDERLYENLLQTKWHEIVGTTIAKYTTEVHLYNMNLVIHTDIASLRQELLYSKGALIEKVNAFFSASIVKEIYVK